MLQKDNSGRSLNWREMRLKPDVGNRKMLNKLWWLLFQDSVWKCNFTTIFCSLLEYKGTQFLNYIVLDVLLFTNYTLEHSPFILPFSSSGAAVDFSNKLKFKALSPSVTIGGFFLSFCWCEIFMAGLNTGWSSKVSISTKKKKKDAYLFCFYSCYSCLFTLQFFF